MKHAPVLTPLEEGAAELGGVVSTATGKETGSPEGHKPCHVHLRSMS